MSPVGAPSSATLQAAFERYDLNADLTRGEREALNRYEKMASANRRITSATIHKCGNVAGGLSLAIAEEQNQKKLDEAKRKADFRDQQARKKRQDQFKRMKIGDELLTKIKQLTESQWTNYKVTAPQLNGLAEVLGIFEDVCKLDKAGKRVLVTKHFVDNQILQQT